jgi:hypothetical protein
MAVLVVGTGRSGTTTTAKILHEKLGVCMGTKFALSAHDDGHCYEDEFFYACDMELMNGRLSLPLWQRLMNYRVEEREATGKPWGYKAPTMTYTLPLLLPYFLKPPKIIWANRCKELTTKSFQKCYGWPEARANLEWENRQRHLRSYLEGTGRPVLKIQYDDPLDEADIEAGIREFLEAS